jgi:predicted nucleic acid-binding protein
MTDILSDLAVDACCLINLYAAEKILAPASPSKSSRPPRRRIVPLSSTPAKPRPGLAFNLHVPAKVIAETLYIRKPDEEDETKLVQVPMDLAALLGAGLLRTCDVNDKAETDLFVQLATTLDDGEAMCLAIAKARGWMLATDDRKGRRLAGQLGVSLLSTAELVKVWAENTSATEAEVVQVLRNIRAFARFVPHKKMPLYRWWTDLASQRK